MRNLTDSEVLTLQAAGCSAENWQSVYIAENLDVSNIEHCRFEGRVEIEEGVTLRGSTIGNYHICQGAKVIDTLRLETRHSSTFGNGVKVAAVNENGGRSVAIYNNLTAQVAYIVAMYRHRKVVVEGILNQIDDFAAAVRSDMGFVGRNSTILGARFIREVNIGEGVIIEGASLLENGTLLTGAYVGVDVNPYEDKVYQNKEKRLPHIIQYEDFDKQILAIEKIIEKNAETLFSQSVGILLPNNDLVIDTCVKLQNLGVQVEFKYNDDESGNFVDTLDFSSSNPKILTYHSAKGLQFDTVILPMYAGASDEESKKALYVAMTRAMHQLYIMYSTPTLNPPLSEVPSMLYMKE